MTLIPFEPQEIDNIALRVLDLASAVRKMAEKARQNNIRQINLHANKIQEWLGKMEEWAHDAGARVDAEISKLDATRRAQQLLQKNKRK